MHCNAFQRNIITVAEDEGNYFKIFDWFNKSQKLQWLILLNGRYNG